MAASTKQLLKCVNAGADILVATRFIFNNLKYKENIKALKAFSCFYWDYCLLK